MPTHALARCARECRGRRPRCPRLHQKDMPVSSLACSSIAHLHKAPCLLVPHPALSPARYWHIWILEHSYDKKATQSKCQAPTATCQAPSTSRQTSNLTCQTSNLTCQTPNMLCQTCIPPMLPHSPFLLLSPPRNLALQTGQ